MKTLRVAFLVITITLVVQAQNSVERQIYCSDAGSTDAYSCVPPVAISSYLTFGQSYTFKANTANTGAATINFGPGVKTIKKVAGGVTTDLATNDIRAGQIVVLKYDGTNMQMVSQSGNAGSGAGDLLSTSNLSDVANAATALTNLGGVGGRTNLTTVGAVPYVSASGVLSQDASTLFWDATNDRLGIGTVTPQTKLDVAGQQIFSLRNQNVLTFNVAGGSNNYASFYTDNTTNKLYLGAHDTLGTVPTTAAMVWVANTGSTLIGGTTDGNYRFDVQKSGSTGTARFYDQTAATGTTLVTLTPGAAQTAASNLLTVSGSATVTGTLYAKSVNEVRMADQFSGADASIKINACVADLPAAGGTCDARGLQGAQAISVTIALTKPVHLILGQATYTSAVFPAITVSDAVIVSGQSGASSGGTTINGPVAGALIQSINTATRYYNVAIRDLRINNTNKATASGIGLDFTNVSMSSVDNVLITNAELGVKLDGTGGGAYYNKFSNVHVSTTVTGWRIQNGANSNTIVGGRSNDATTGVIIDNSTSNTLLSVSIEAITGTGISISPVAATNGTLISGCRLEGTGGAATGVLLGATAGSVTLQEPYFANLSANITDNSTARRLVVNYDGFISAGVPIGNADAKLETSFSNGGNDNTGLLIRNLSTSGYGGSVTFAVSPAGTYNSARIASENTGGNGGQLKFFTANTSQALIERASFDQSGNFTVGALVTSLNIKRGTGSPEGVVTGAIGDVYQRTDGGAATTLYIKESGAGNTGWVGAGSGGAGTAVTRTVVSFSATPVFTRSTQIQEWEITLTGNVTSSTTSGVAAADILIFNICQDGTGSRTFAWPTGFGQAVTISPTLSVCTKQTFYWDGTNAQAITPGTTTDTGLLITGATITAPAAPASGSLSIYAKTGSGLCQKDSGGTETCFGVGGGAPTTVQYLTLATDATLTVERVLTPGSGIQFTDAGAGSTLTVAFNDAVLAGVYPTIAGPNTFTAGGKNTFQASATTAGLRIVGTAAPSSLAAGDIWIDLTGQLVWSPDGAATSVAGGTQTIASGATALNFASTATGACATVITATATGAASTDVIIFNANASIKAVTGYVPASTGGFSIAAYPSANLVSFEACNWTAGTVDPGSITVNWVVIR